MGLRRTAGVLAAAVVVGGGVAARRRARSPRTVLSRGCFSNGVEYAALGTGSRTMLFLPGGPGTPTWQKTLERSFLHAYAGGEFAVWWLSRRRNMPAGHTVADMADDVADVIAELGGRVDAVVGASYGGMIALHLAARYPDRVARVVLLASAASIPDDAKKLDRRLGESLGNGRFTEASESMLAELMPGKRTRRLQRVLAPIAGKLLASSGYNLADVLVETQAEMDYDARSVLSQITAPVLIVAGDRDTFFPREVIEETAKGIFDCTVIWHEGAGHVGVIRGKGIPGEVLAFLGRDIAGKER